MLRRSRRIIVKRRIACTLVILLALLCGCQAPNPDNIDEEEFREELQEAMRDVVADSGEAVPVINLWRKPIGLPMG
jgi:hypothetical protein